MTNIEVNLQNDDDTMAIASYLDKTWRRFIGTLLISQYLNKSILFTEEKESQGAPFIRSSYYKNGSG